MQMVDNVTRRSQEEEEVNDKGDLMAEWEQPKSRIVEGRLV